jgi:ribosomal protein L37AE/L43A
MKPLCRTCGEPFAKARHAAGYRVCLLCGEEQARAVKHTIVPMHKSNYVVMTNRLDLQGINNKGGLVRI